jgi:hypothetical protein
VSAPEDGGISMFRQSVGIYLQVHTALLSRRPASSSSWPEHQISSYTFLFPSMQGLMTSIRHVDSVPINFATFNKISEDRVDDNLYFERSELKLHIQMKRSELLASNFKQIASYPFFQKVFKI